MRTILLFILGGLFFTSCSNSSDSASTFCDTACIKDSIGFKGDTKFEQALVIKFDNCDPGSVTWESKWAKRIIDLPEYLNKDVKLNPSFVDCAFQDTTAAWLSFNDCVNGRGYLLKLPYSKSQSIGTYKAALNSFDKKYAVEKDLRAFTDGGNIYVVNVTNGKTAEMTFKEAYEVDYDQLHDVVDSVNVTKSRIYVKLIKEGKEIPLEKGISL